MNRSLIFLFIATSTLLGCSSKSTNDIEFNTAHLQYDMNSDTGLCFAVTGVVVGGDAALGINHSVGLGLDNVECSEAVLKKIDPEKIKLAMQKGSYPPAADTLKIGN